MESVAPPLKLLLSVKRAIEKGISIKEGINNYISLNQNQEFAKIVTLWFLNIERAVGNQDLLKQIHSPYRRSLLQILERGLNKESIYSTLLNLEQEIIEACDSEIQEKLTKLPYLLMIPVLLFQFPALLMLIFGPLVQNFIESMH